MNKALIIYNPVSGAQFGMNAEKIIQHELNSAGWTYQWFETEAVDKQKFNEVISEDFDLIVGVGGDGTINEIANHLVTNKIDVPLAVIARGSGNILAQSLQLPIMGPKRAIKFALQGTPKAIDAMRVNKKYLGLIAAGQGYDAVFMHGATRALKRRIGVWAYLYSFLRTFFTYHRHSFKIEVDGKSYEVKAKLVAVFNVLSLMGVSAHKSVKIDDGMLNIAILSPRSLWDLIRIPWKAMFDKIKPDDEEVRLLTGEKIIIEEEDGNEIQIDGEVIKARKLEVEVIPNALRIVCK